MKTIAIVAGARPNFMKIAPIVRALRKHSGDLGFTIIHTGIATEVGILPTAWHALNIGLFAVVPEDCVGPMVKEHHEDAMRFLRRLAIATSSNDILEAWEAGPHK